MWGLPSFLSWPFALPHLPSISLPANIQRRFLSYVLRRTLGRFVKSGGLDVERIQAQISEGWVEIEGLEIDPEPVNELLPPGLPLSVVSGALGRVTARVPFPNLWSDPLALTLESLTLDLLLSPAFDSQSPSTTRRIGGRSSGSAPPFSPIPDLAASVTSAADEFLHEELDAYEEAQLDRSIRDTLSLSATTPTASGDVPGAFPFPSQGDDALASAPSSTVLAGLVERVLARLQLKVQTIRVRVRSPHPEHACTFELRIDQVRYADESDSDEQATMGGTTRAVRVSGFQIYMLPYSPVEQETAVVTPIRPATTSRRSSSSSTASTDSTASESSSTDSTDPSADMAMSMAVADLRESTASIASGASVYESAHSEQFEMSRHIQDFGQPEPLTASTHSATTERTASAPSRSATPVPTESQHRPEVLLLSLGQEDIVVKMRTEARGGTSPDTTSPGARISFVLTVGAVTVLAVPSQLAQILVAGHSLARRPGNGLDETASRAEISVRAVHATVIYDATAEHRDDFTSSINQFWQRPATTHVPFGHVKLRMDDVQAKYGDIAPEVKANAESSVPTGAMVTATVRDVALFEYIASESASTPVEADDLPPGGAFPILIFDPGLAQVYDQTGHTGRSAPTETNAHAFPEYDAVDWRNSGLHRKNGGGEKAWRIRPKARSALKSARDDTSKVEEPAVSWSGSSDRGGSSELRLQPIHVFLDLSLVERLLPLLRSLSPLFKQPQATQSRASQSPVTPRSTQANRRAAAPGGHDPHAASISTVQGIEKPSVSLTASCPVIRLDIRCPAPPSRRGTWGESGHLRSGIVTLDVVGLSGQMLRPLNTNDKRISFSLTEATDVANVSVERMLVYFCRASERKSTAFLTLGPLRPDAADDPDIAPLLPQILIQRTTAPGATTPVQLVTCQVPSVGAKIRQTTIEGIQFFADDMAQWLDGAFGDASAPKPKDDLKMIGSRFFGSRASSSDFSSSVDDDDDDVDASPAARFRLLVSDVDISLHVPRKGGLEGHSERVLALRASDVDAKIESKSAPKQETLFNLAIMDIDFSDRSDPAAPSRILARTMASSLTQHHPPPLISLRFSSLADAETGNKETGIKLACSGWTFFVNKDLAWIGELARFAKTPEGVFEDMTPSEITRVHVQLHDCSVHVAAPTIPGGLVGVLGDFDFKTDLVSDADEQTLELSLARSFLFAVDHLDAVTALPAGRQLSHEAWRVGLVPFYVSNTSANACQKAGWAQMAELVSLQMQVWKDLSGTDAVAVDVLSGNVKLMGCADSLATVGPLMGDMANLVPRKATVEEVVPPAYALDRSINVFASLDEEAFRRVPDITSGVDMIDDDLPTNLDYLDTASKQPANEVVADRTTGETLRSWQTDEESDFSHTEGDPNNGTIRILLKEPLNLEDENYWDNLQGQQAAQNAEYVTFVHWTPLGILAHLLRAPAGKLHVRIHDFALGVLLHEGYDWQRTRKTIEDEMKVMRKRLERIRQLLASGQTADDSIERPSSLLYNSIYIGLEQSQADLDRAALLAAIDEELDDLDGGGGDTASQSSWQSLPTVRGPKSSQPAAVPTSTKTRLRGKRLTRSKKPQVEISLDGVRGDIDLYGPTEEIASKVEVNVKSLEILDHIKTSTWKKFLTEMKADSRGNVRETDADMVRLSMTTVRPSLPALAEEVRLKAKVLPLRLHVDQDAMDFLKRLSSFKPSAAPGPAGAGASAATQPAKAPPATPFFQHVEIYPVQLKLDYKPKRVDFNALREGKTIELMNFFHFDGAEMTLRHITLSGVAGWDRLSTLLQDTWTPDVKANQLADVISGVSPIRSVVNVGSGVADLILLPIEQYRKDGRIAKGVQRGANSFVKSTALEMMKLGAKLATGTQVVLERAESVLGGRVPEQLVGEVDGASGDVPGYSPGWGGDDFEVAYGGGTGGSSSGDEDDADGRAAAKRDALSRYANQPENATAGVQAAYKSLSRNINSAAQTILAVPMEVYERSGDDGPLKAVVRAVPIAVLKPMIGATEAVSKTLLGVRNSIDPEARRQLGDKYK